MPQVIHGCPVCKIDMAIRWGLQRVIPAPEWEVC